MDELQMYYEVKEARLYLHDILGKAECQKQNHAF